MSRLILLIVGLLSAALCSGASLQIEPKHATFGDAISGSRVHQAYVISNTGPKPVALREWKAISGQGSVIGLPAALAPGESRDFAVELDVPGKLGESGFRYAVFTDEADVERYRFTLSGFVYSLIEPENASVDFGSAPVLPDTQRELTFSAREDRPLKLVEVVQAPDWLKIDIEQSTAKLRIIKTPTLGLKSGVIRISTNLPQQPFIEITSRALIGGALESSIYAVGFKPAEIGETVTTSMNIRYRGKSSLDKMKVELPPGWTSSRSKCTEAVTDGRACVQVTVNRKIEKAGQVSGDLRFRMPDDAELTIPFGVIGLREGQNVRELLVNEDPTQTRPEPIDISALPRRDSTVTGSQPAQVAADPAPAEKVSRGQGSGPVHLKWTARKDDSLYGYMVYRSADRAGPFRRVNARPIPALAGNATEPSKYTFTDADVEPGKTYYYYIDSLSKGGTQTRLSPVLSKSVTE